MRRARLPALAPAIAALGLILVASAMFDPAVQTWVARRELRRRFGPGASIGRVEARLGSVVFVDVTVRRGGAVLTVPLLRAEMPMLPALWERRVAVRRLVSAGWTLDLSGSPAPRTGGGEAPTDRRAEDPASSRDPPPASTHGPRIGHRRDPRDAARAFILSVFTRLRLPFNLSVDRATLNGDIVLPPSPGGSPTAVRASLTGGGLGVGREGRFVVRLAASEPPGSRIQEVDFDGELSAAMDTPRTFSHLRLRMNATAFGPGAPRGVRLIVELGASWAAAGESYTAVVSGERKPIAELLFDVPAATGRPEGTWRINVSDDDLTPFALGRVLPAFLVAGQGRFDCDADGDQAHVFGGIDATFERLGAIRPALEALGAVRVTGDFDVTRSGSLWRIDRVAALAQGAGPILAARSLQPFAFDAATAELNVARADSPLFGIDLEGVPARWLEAVFPEARISGRPIRGELTATARRGRLSLRTAEALTAPGLSVSVGGRSLVRAADASCALTAEYTEAGWQVEIGSAKLMSGGRTLVAIEGKLGQRQGPDRAVKMEGKATVDLGEALPGLRSGDLAAHITASLGRRSAVDARFSVSNLKPKEAGAPIGPIAGDLRVAFDPAGRMSFALPLALARTGPGFDLEIAGTSQPGRGGRLWTGRITGSRLDLDEVRTLAAALTAPAVGVLASERAAGPRAAAPTSDRAVFAVRFGRVVIGRMAATNVAGDLRLGGGRLALRGVSAALETGGRLTGGAEVDALAPSAAGGAFRLALAGELDGFDPGPALSRLNPGQPPALQGEFTLDGQFEGRGSSLREAASRLQGTCSVESKAGRFRLLSTVVSPKSSGGALDTLLGVAGKVGGIIWRHKPGEFANGAEAMIYLGKAVSDIAYDQLSLTLVRGPTLDTEMRDFALISPELRLEGGGRIRHEAGVPFVAQPLDATFRLSARGRAAAALKRVDALGPKADGLGYQPFPVPITIRGSLDKPDTAELQAALLKLASGSGGLFNRLFGK
ncbi:MAG: AsmA-like C-terminal region-containing protein [Opitutaceae bacterium]